jgi:hypothetical protein
VAGIEYLPGSRSLWIERAVRIDEKGSPMKALWNSIGRSVLALAVVYPWMAGAQPKTSPTPTGVTAASQPVLLAHPALVAPASPATLSPAPVLSAAAPLSPWASEIAKLARAGIHEDIILTYIDGTEGTFNLTADQIIELRNLGLSSQAIAAMMRHDGEVNAGVRKLAASTLPASQPTLHIVLTSAGKSPQVGDKPVAASSAGTESSASGTESVGEDKAAGDEAGDTTYPEYSGEWQPEFSYGDELTDTVQARPIGLAQRYPVRQPYVEELTAPILVFKASGRTPNVIVIDFLP